MTLAEVAVAKLTAAFAPGAFFVDSMPILRYLPAWVPGAAGFHRAAAEGKALTDELMELPYERTKAELVCTELFAWDSLTNYYFRRKAQQSHHLLLT